MHVTSSVLTTPEAANGSIQWRGQMSNDVGTTAGAKAYAILTASPEALELTGTLGTYRVPRSAVVRFYRGQLYPWFFRGFRIDHRAPDLPKNLQFCPTEARTRELLSKLKALGYPVG